MAYGNVERVKAKKRITDTTYDTEITNILSDISDLIDFYLDGYETTPVTDATRLKALNYAVNVIAMGEFEMRYNKRDNEIGAWSIYNHGWSIFDKYLQKVHGIDIKSINSAKVVVISPGWRYGEK